MRYLFALCVLLKCVYSVNTQFQKKTNLDKCKLTLTGIEYAGDISHTKSGFKCQEWKSINSSYHIYNVFDDNDFPDKSISLAKSFCRNVKERFKTPWCYTVNQKVNDEVCDIPLCNFDCRMTLIGSEYGGDMNFSLNGRQCLEWSEKTYRKYLQKYMVVTTDRILLDEKFPELSRKKALNYCRNPTSDPNGLWCLVEDDFQEKIEYEKEYCDLKLCDKIGCSAGTSRFNDAQGYTHFINLNNTDHFEFSILLWNSDLANYTFRVAFSVYPLPLSGQKMININNGIELVISRHGLGFVEKTGKEVEWRAIHNLLTSHKKTKFRMYWFSPQISVEVIHSKKTLPLTATYNFNDPKNNSIIANNNGQFVYYSIMGDAALWELPCYTKCNEEITTQSDCNFYRMMNKTEENFVMPFIVRSDRTVYIELRNSPNSKFPYFKIEIRELLKKISVVLVLNNRSTSVDFVCSSHTSLSYWSWTEFELTAVGDHLQLKWIRSLVPPEVVCSIEHVAVANAKWYSICSYGTAHWMFACEKKDVPILPKQKLPECVLNKKGETYSGTRWITESGQPCFPWISELLDKYVKGFSFVTTTRKTMMNYCRNLISDNEGPFCYVLDIHKLPALVMKKEYCNIGRCPISQCRVTGIGKDYDGDLNVTRTNRTCRKWSESKVTNKNLTENYCRNPDNRTFGPWCFTTDGNVPSDLCSVRDCVLDDGFTVINNGTESSFKIYIHPDWITNGFFFYLKSWNPLVQVGVALNLLFEKSKHYFRFEIGAENNTKIRLLYVNSKGDSMVKQEKLITKLIPLGYWQGFWLSLPPMNITFGYHGSDTPIFSWQNPPHSKPLEYCKYVSFSNLNNYLVGLNFPSEYCLVHRAYKYFVNTFYPFNFGRTRNTTSSNMSLYLRNDDKDSSGDVSIIFFGENEFSFIKIVIDSTGMSLRDESALVLSQVGGIRLDKFWINLTISYNESYISIETNRNITLNWSSLNTRILRLYYFTITAHDTTIEWVSNCDPPSDDEQVVDGGWSEWTDFICSVRCGGGVGNRTRDCIKPPPSFKGKPCIGANYDENVCNTFKCGCINPESYQKINETLESRALNKEVKFGENIIFQCARNIITDIILDSPGSYLQWLKNGYRISKKDKLKLDKIQIERTDLELSNIEDDDAGVYVCVVHPFDCPAPNNATFVPVTIVALVVKSDEVHEAQETTQFLLTCNGLILFFIYDDLSQFWELDNELMIDYTSKPLDEVDMDIISEIEPSYAGTWTCKVKQNRLNLTWITNRFKLNVIEPPSFWRYLTTEDAPSLVFQGWNYVLVALFLYAIVIIEIAVVGFIAYWYWTRRQELLGLRDTKQ